MFAFAAMSVSGQDLGSSNKIFGGGKTKKDSAAMTKKKTSAKSSAKRKSTTAKKTTPAKKPATTTALKKKNTRPTKADATAAKTTTTKTTTTTITKTAAEKSEKPKTVKVNTDRFKADRVAAEKPKVEIKPTKTSEPLLVTKNVAAEEKYNDLIDEGNYARDDRNYSTAESAYKRARAVKPKDYRAVYGLGNLYSDQQRWDEAENAYRTALQLNSSSGLTHIALSYVLTQPIGAPNLADRYEEAEKLARKAIELSPRTALGFDQLGVSMESRGLISQETETAYRKALAIDDSFAPAHAHLGRLLRRRGATKDAEKSYDKAVELATDVGTMVVVADVMQSEQRYKESESLLRDAVTADPQNPAALIMFGRALTALNKYDEAEAILKRSVTASQNGFMSNSLLATLYTRQGKLEMAERALMQALRSVPSYENARLRQQFRALGDGYTRAGKRSDATRVFRQAEKLDAEKDQLTGMK